MRRLSVTARRADALPLAEKGRAETKKGFPNFSGTLFLFKWAEGESNPRHQDFQSCALPTELSAQTACGTVRKLSRAKELFSGAGC